MFQLKPYSDSGLDSAGSSQKCTKSLAESPPAKTLHGSLSWLVSMQRKDLIFLGAFGRILPRESEW